MSGTDDLSLGSWIHELKVRNSASILKCIECFMASRRYLDDSSVLRAFTLNVLKDARSKVEPSPIRGHDDRKPDPVLLRVNFRQGL